ncbi:aconitase X [Lacibacterium aquatile]|uniref:Aconitase X n=1 Tax=Lacibacterium aquatile TaxID=1168082 RepID=A0ABW5DXS6_9PROT
MHLTAEEREIAAGADAQAMAMRIVADAGRLLGADRLIPIASSHIDGALYHGDSGTEFAERLVAGGATVAVPTTLNVGSLDLHHPGVVRLAGHPREMALRLMQAYEAMGCARTWTCAPYQAGHRPIVGTDVAWGESNAVAFCNSVLGARTNRYGDFMDIACALVARAPNYGLHLPENRRASIVVDVSGLSPELRAMDAFYPVLGSWFGRTVGTEIGAVVGLQGFTSEDKLKAFGAAAASSGAVGLFHIVGVTPEAPTLEAIADNPRMIRVDAAMIREARAKLSTASGSQVDAVAVGSPHFSVDEFRDLHRLLNGRKLRMPFYANTGRHAVKALEAVGLYQPLKDQGIEFVVDTCVVVTPILKEMDGVLITNSGKFAHYATGNTGYGVQYGSLSDCVETAVAGRLVRDEASWS